MELIYHRIGEIVMESSFQVSYSFYALGCSMECNFSLQSKALFLIFPWEWFTLSLHLCANHGPQALGPKQEAQPML